MRRPRAGTAIVLVAVLGAIAGIVTWRVAGSAGPHPPHPQAEPAARRHLLADLRDRMVPSSSGGWVIESPADPSLEGWLLASSQQARSAGAFDRALASVADAGLDGADGRALALVLAEVLPGPTADRARAEHLAGEVLQQSLAHLDRDPAWLAPLLQLSAGSTGAAAGAADELARRAGAVGCDALPGPRDALAPPGAELTVLLRLLAVRHERCPGAEAVLEAALDDPHWDTWIATVELTDLAMIAGPLADGTAQRLRRRLDGFLAITAEQPIDLGAVVEVQAARTRLGWSTEIRGPLAHHLEGQVAHRGGLPGRSTSAPTPFDVAIVRQLVGEGLVPETALRSTRAASEAPAVDGDVDPVLGELLAGSDPIGCDRAPDAPPERGRVSIDGVVTDEIWAAARAACGGDLDLVPTVRRLRSGSPAEQVVLRIAAAELTACRIDRSLLDPIPGLRIDVTGGFADDATVAWARSVAADPRAACAAANRI